MKKDKIIMMGCPSCYEDNSIEVKKRVTENGYFTFVRNCKDCGKQHEFDNHGNLQPLKI